MTVWQCIFPEKDISRHTKIGKCGVAIELSWLTQGSSKFAIKNKSYHFNEIKTKKKHVLLQDCFSLEDNLFVQV